MADHEQQTDGNGNGSLDALPGLARIAASAWLHGAEWALRGGVRTGLKLAGTAADPRRAADLLRDTRGAARGLLRELLSASGIEDPEPETHSDNGDRRSNHSNGVPRTLREEGELLLRRSRDVHYEVEAHPAYERILSELAPDEGRILRLLLFDGPQPAVDIRTGGPLGLVKSRLIAPGLSMIGARSGCRYVERVPSYLNNLFRLGLIWFSRETLADPMRYQVLEAQPDVLEAIHSVAHAKVVRRSVHLTPFGDDFCRVCLNPDGSGPDLFPEHSAPPQTQTTPRPPTVAEG